MERGIEQGVSERDGSVEGEDPLAPFGPHAARHLRREAEFPNVPDILVISSVDPVTGEVPAFEELVGNYGELGGWQCEPFLLYRPSSTSVKSRSSVPATCTTS